MIEPAPSRVAWRTLVQAWLGLFLLFAAFAHGNLETTDSAMTMHAARALWLRGDSGLLPSGQGAQWLAEGVIADEIARHEGEPAPRYGKKGRDGTRRYVWFPMGHLCLMVPCVVAGEALARAFPAVEERYRAVAGDNYLFGQFTLDQACVAMVLPAASGATIGVLLFLIALALGCQPSRAALCSVAILFGSQCFALGRETLSDGPGLAFLLGALLAVVRANAGDLRRSTLVLGGVAAGLAVLTRYPHGLLVPPLALAMVLALRQRGRTASFGWFALGGLPLALLLCAVNYARYGSISDTGYPPFTSWFNYPLWFGVSKLLIAAGKGILWLSPMLWLALPAAARRSRPLALRWLAWTLFAIPMVLFGMTNGWQSGQCWGARYVTPAVVAMLALVLPQTEPWRHRPRTFWALLVLGFGLAVTSLVAPTRGAQQLAAQGVEAMYANRLAEGRITAADFASAKDDPADHFSFQPRFSPIHVHWHYALRSATGGFEDGAGRPRDGAEFTIEPLFGIRSTEPAYGRAPSHWEDRGGRHLWFCFWGALLGVPSWLLLLIPLVPAVALLWAVRRGLSKN